MGKKEKSIFVTEKEQAGKSMSCAQYYSCPSKANPRTSPTPTLTQRDTKSILPVFTRCRAGMWRHRGLSNMEQADALHLRNLYPKRKEGKHVYSQPIFSRENRPQRKPFPVCISECKYFPNFCLGGGAGVDWLFLWDWEELLLPRLRGNEMLTAANTCLSFFGEIIAP